MRWTSPARPRRPGVPVGGVAEARAELDDPLRLDGAGEHLERDADVAPDDREASLLGVGLHLEEDRLVETAETLLHVGLDPRIDDVHDGTISRRP